MFTCEDICAIAVQIEKNGEAAYRRAAERASRPAMVELFQWMAGDEQRHGRFFAAMGGGRLDPAAATEAEKLGRNLLQEMVRAQTFDLDAEQLAASEDVDDFLSQSVAFEEDTILFYQFLADLVDDAEVRRQLVVIIDEERRHVEMLIGMAGQEREAACLS